MTMNSPNEYDFFNTLHLQSVYTSLHKADALMTFFFIQSPREQGVLWYTYGVMSELLTSVQENAEVHFRLENNNFHSMETSRRGPPGYSVFLLLLFLWYLMVTVSDTFYAHQVIYSQITLPPTLLRWLMTACPYSHTFIFLLSPLVSWTMMIAHFKVEILIPSHQSLPILFTISLISEEQEHLTPYTCALCSNLISVLSSSWESASLPSSLHQEMKIFRVRDFSFNFCHKVFEILATFFTVSCPQTFWNIFWFIFQRETCLV